MIGPIYPALRARRKALGLSQLQVAERAGLDQAYYSKVEQGKVEPRIGTLQDVARALSLEVMLVPVDIVSTVSAMSDRQQRPSAEQPLFAASED